MDKLKRVYATFVKSAILLVGLIEKDGVFMDISLTEQLQLLHYHLFPQILQRLEKM